MDSTSARYSAAGVPVRTDFDETALTFKLKGAHVEAPFFLFGAVHASTRFEKNSEEHDEYHDGAAGLTSTASASAISVANRILKSPPHGVHLSQIGFSDSASGVFFRS